jgi:Uma2 family endonuclease
MPKGGMMRRGARTPAEVKERLEPTWEIARLFPYQGAWSEDEYLLLNTNHLFELSDGILEALPMPTTPHQLLLLYLYGQVLSFTEPRDLGWVLAAALPVQLWRDKYREPDVVFMLKENAARIRVRYWKGADLVMEVVRGQGKDRRRDLVTKRREYARAGISEYWIVDPQEQLITVLRLPARAMWLTASSARAR